MFNFLEARIATMLRTSTSLLRRARRHLMKDLRQLEEQQQKDWPQLQEATKTGDVDKVKERFLLACGQLQKIEYDLVRIERDTFMAEWDSVDKITDIDNVSGQVKSFFAELRNSRPNLAPQLQAVENRLQKVFESLHAIEQEELAELSKQFLAIERQQQGEVAQLQTFVWAVSNVMAAMDQFWNLRGEVRKERREEKDIFKTERRILTILKELAGESKPDIQKKLIDELAESESRIEREFAEFMTLFRKAELGFTLVLKVCSDIHFEFLKEQKRFEEFNAVLLKTGFPKIDLDRLTAELSKEDAAVKSELKKLVDVVRRGTRLQGARLNA